MARVRGLAIFLVLAGCARPAPPSPWEKLGVRVVDGVPQLDDVEIALERTTCFGTCPAYSIKLSGDGTLTYAGISSVKTRGEQKSSFDPKKLLPLLELSKELDLLTGKHECPVSMMDNSHAFLSVRIGPRSGRVEDQVCAQDFEGWFSSVPGDVEWHVRAYRLEEAIDALANVESWIGSYEERQAHMNEWR